MRLAVILCAITLAMPCPAFAADACAALTVKATAVSRATDAALVHRLSKQSVSAADIGTVLAEGGWRLVWATPKDAERGVFFFRRTGKARFRLVDTWGGVIAPDDRASSIDWALKLKGGGPSRRLATCFVDAVMAEK